MSDLRTLSEVLAEALATCQQIHTRPMMYAGCKNLESKAAEIDMAFWFAYRHYLFIQSRESELGEAVRETLDEFGYGACGFVDSYRSANPDASHEEVFDATMGFWSSVARKLGVDPTFYPRHQNRSAS